MDVDRYEFLVYRLVRNALEAGNVFVRESTEFRRFEDDLISDARWQDKEAVLREIGAPCCWPRFRTRCRRSTHVWMPSSPPLITVSLRA